MFTNLDSEMLMSCLHNSLNFNPTPDTERLNTPKPHLIQKILWIMLSLEGFVAGGWMGFCWFVCVPSVFFNYQHCQFLFNSCEKIKHVYKTNVTSFLQAFASTQLCGATLELCHRKHMLSLLLETQQLEMQPTREKQDEDIYCSLFSQIRNPSQDSSLTQLMGI